MAAFTADLPPSRNWPSAPEGNGKAPPMDAALEKLGLRKTNHGVFCGEWRGSGSVAEKVSPIDGKVIARVREATPEDYEWAVLRAQAAFLKWRTTPAPVRGETIRCLGNALRRLKKELGRLVTLESGKILAEKVCRETGADPAIFTLIIGGVRTIGERMTGDRRIPLVSATGSCAMGVTVAQAVHRRMGRTLLELGGNNAVIVTGSADLNLAARAIFFGAVGTAGQRCTSTRRVIVHASVEKALSQRLIKAYRSVQIGNPLEPSTLMGPLIDPEAVRSMAAAIKRVRQEGGRILHGGKALAGRKYPGGCYVTPCLATAQNHFEIVQEETFAPLLYLIGYEKFEEAIALHNAVPQGLSSAIFTNDLREAEEFMSVRGSDCGIANVNAGTSGAEIGGAFGGEKETGGGRESGSDAWKNYMRRQTNTINFSSDLPLAQGIQFGENKS